MKHLLLIILFSGSLDSFSQDKTEKLYLWPDGKYSVLDPGPALPPPTPDTLRAIILVTLSPNGIAHSRMGFVVISEGKRPVYLDCRKKALKLPAAGWGWEVINSNSNK
jgi:hypothetical protein